MFLRDSREKHRINLGGWHIVGSALNTTNPTSFLMCFDLKQRCQPTTPCEFEHASVTHTCAINWIILTKILRGMSLGTTLRLPLGNRVEVMDVRRLGDKREETQADREGKVLRHKLHTFAEKLKISDVTVQKKK